MADEGLRYVILTEKSPDKLSLAVSALMDEGWQLHGELKLQVMADGTSLTFASVVYIQAMRREKPKPAAKPRPPVIRKDPRKDPRFLRS